MALRILCAFPGRFGDVIWALPTMRAISQAAGAPVDIMICGEFATLAPLLEQQPYLGCVWTDPEWHLVPPAEWDYKGAGDGYDHVIKMGYRGWPDQPLPFCTYATVQREYPEVAIAPLDLETPWITVAEETVTHAVIEGWTGEWFELKYGLHTLLRRQFNPYSWLNLSNGERWQQEGYTAHWDWVDVARFIKCATVFLGDCSALHVLAVALGTQVVCVEPAQDRLNPIFWPLGMDGRVKVVKGGDGLPTHDARHCADALREALHATTK